jgi:predicted nuclease of predicted toxin-antitoxin system
VKFLIDMPVTPQAVAFLAGLGHDAIHASVVGLATATDTEILAHQR